MGERCEGFWVGLCGMMMVLTPGTEECSNCALHLSPHHGVSDGVFHKAPNSIVGIKQPVYSSFTNPINPEQCSLVKAGFEHMV